MSAELKMAAFIAEHNVAFLATDHLVPLQKSMFPDSEIAKSVKCSRTKTAAIIKNVFGVQQREFVCTLLNQHKFSICADESTDVSSSKLLSIVVKVRFADRIRDFFFDLVEVHQADAKGIYSEIVKSFNNHNVNYKNNLIGFAADGANVMTGSRNSVATLLRIDCPNIVILKCICHSFALCSSYASEKLPSSVELLAREIYNYIENSAKNIDKFADIQSLLDYKPRKMLQLSQTRWLSLEAVVIRLLDRYDCLKIFFNFAVNIDKIGKAKHILEHLSNHLNEMFLNFLSFILPLVNNLNKLFQSENPTIHILYSQMERLTRTILECFIKSSCLRNSKLDTIEYKNPSNFVNLEDLYLGANVQLCLKKTKLNREQENLFYLSCLNYYVELTTQIFKRFDFKNEALKLCQYLDPQNVIVDQNKTIFPLVNLFPHLVPEKDVQLIDSEWREMKNLNFTDLFDINEIKVINVETFWKTVFKTKRADDTKAFPYLEDFVYSMLSLSVSSANVERTFSVINLNKTKLRNRLNNVTLSGILLTKEYLKVRSFECHSFKPEAGLYEKFNHLIYEKN